MIEHSTVVFSFLRPYIKDGGVLCTERASRSHLVWVSEIQILLPGFVVLQQETAISYPGSDLCSSTVYFTQKENEK
jgi:hypothetical protein